MFDSSAFFIIAEARGCWERYSNAVITDNNSFSFVLLFNTLKSVTTGTPLVNVPVLSNAIAFKAPISSKYTPPFTSTPFLAAFPIAETIEIGVEITNAQGQPTTNTAKP